MYFHHWAIRPKTSDHKKFKKPIKVYEENGQIIKRYAYAGPKQPRPTEIRETFNSSTIRGFQELVTVEGIIIYTFKG